MRDGCCDVLMILLGVSLIWLWFVVFSVRDSAQDWKLMVDKQLHQHVVEIDRLERRMDEGY